MSAALLLVTASVAIAVLRPAKPAAVAAILALLITAIASVWVSLPQLSYAWLPTAHVIFAGRDDTVARVAATLVSLIAAIVIVYALGDPETDDDSARFFATYALFVGAMLAFVESSSLLFAYVCWEVMGIASFVLIGHNVDDFDAGRSARRALTTTRFGDLSVLIGAALLGSGSVAAGAAFLVVGAAVKSAQLGASPWLVGAMVAPTPVSALLHSATLVAAGPYLVARFVPLADVPAVATLLLAYATLTALAAAIFAATSDDAKRTLAWSSIEQLAQAFVASAVGMPLLAFGVLAGHALAKPALFFAAGVQRIATGTSRYAAASRSSRRIAAFVAAIAYGGIALVGIPPFVSSWALADTWTAASRAAPILLLAGVTLAALGGWYVMRFGLLLTPDVGRPFDERRIGPGARLAVWLIGIVGVSVSLLFLQVGFNAASVALPVGAMLGAGACYALRHAEIVQRAPLLADGVATWDACFNIPATALARALDAVDRGLLIGTDRLGAAVNTAGRGVSAVDLALDRTTSDGARDVVAGGVRAGSFVAGDVSRYLALSGGIFVAAGVVAVVIILIRSVV